MQPTTYHTRDVIRIADSLLTERKFKKPWPMVRFSEEELRALIDFIFFRPPTVELRIRQRAMQARELNLRRNLFIKYFFQTLGNGAKAARMAGYSPKCAKQIAYRLLRS